MWQDSHSVAESMKTSVSKRYAFVQSCKRTFFIAKTYKKIPLVAFATFAAICAVGLATVLIFAKQHSHEMLAMAEDKALDTDRFLENEIRKSILPLFAMDQFVKHLDVYDPLPGLVEPRPFRDDNPVFRNVTGKKMISE